MTKKSLQINSENILPIIKKWLYSDKDIFLRELVSNSCDAMSKLKILRDKGEIDFKDEELKIEIKIDKKASQISITDTGIGMNAEEVEKYIAQLAFSGAEDFMSKYQEGSEKDQIIGHFGLGFYSSFMVSDHVELDTLSYKKDEKPALWSCDGSSEYDLKASKKKTRGCDITLHIDEENKEFLEEAKLKAILEKYCSFLPFPIFLNDTQVNDQEPLWLRKPSDVKDEEYLKLYRHLYPMEEDPIFWIHLNVDYPFHLKGILFFPKITKRFDFQKTNIHLYCNRVFVSDDVKDLIPDYLMVLRGALDSPDIPLNVSRSYLQVDATVRALSTHIAKKVTDKLASLYQSDFKKYSESFSNFETILKLGILQDTKFYERSKDLLIWKNTSDAWTSIKDYKERCESKHKDKVFYTTDERHTSHFLEMYKDKGIEVLYASSSIDSPLMSFLEGKDPSTKFQRIDSALDENLINKEKEDSLLDSEGKTEATKMADAFKTLLSDDMLDVEAKSLSSDHLPAFIMIDEQSRRMRDYLAMTHADAGKFPQKRTLILNTNNKLIKAIYNLQNSDENLAKELSQQIYDLSLLSQKELDPSQFSNFIKRSSEVLERLAEKATL